MIQGLDDATLRASIHADRHYKHTPHTAWVVDPLTE